MKYIMKDVIENFQGLSNSKRSYLLLLPTLPIIDVERDSKPVYLWENSNSIALRPNTSQEIHIQATSNENPATRMKPPYSFCYLYFHVGCVSFSH